MSGRSNLALVCKKGHVIHPRQIFTFSETGRHANGVRKTHKPAMPQWCTNCARCREGGGSPAARVFTWSVDESAVRVWEAGDLLPGR